MVSTRWLSKPGFTDCSSSRLRSMSPAPMSSTMDTATCATTRAARIRLDPPPLTAAPPSLSAATRLALAGSAGSTANARPVSTQTTRVKASTSPSSAISAGARREARGEPGEEPHGRRRERQPERAACQREQPALGEHLPEEPHPIGAEGGAQGHLARAAGEPREGEVRDVGAGDEEDEGGGADQEQQGGPGILGELVVQRGRRDGEALAGGIGGGVFRAQRARDPLELGLRLRDGHRRRHPAEDVEHPGRARVQGELPHAERAGGGRHVHVVLRRILRHRRQHADHRVDPVVHLEGLPHDRRIAAQAVHARTRSSAPAPARRSAGPRRGGRCGLAAGARRARRRSSRRRRRSGPGGARPAPGE